jgi:hypothetical protein
VRRRFFIQHFLRTHTSNRPLRKCLFIDVAAEDLREAFFHTPQRSPTMSALPRKAKANRNREVGHVRFVPKADILRCGKRSLFDHVAPIEDVIQIRAS